MKIKKVTGYIIREWEAMDNSHLGCVVSHYLGLVIFG